jgi:hypothetical protein
MRLCGRCRSSEIPNLPCLHREIVTGLPLAIKGRFNSREQTSRRREESE